MLAHFIGTRSDIFANKSCIELGSGAGLTGLFCAQFARKTIMTDRNDDGKCSAAARGLTLIVLDLLRANIERNGLRPEQCSVASLDWGEPLSDEVAEGAPYDVVLASDVMCEPEMHFSAFECSLHRSYPGHTAEIVGRLFKSAVSLMGLSTPFVVSYVPRDNSVTQLIFDAAEACKLKCIEVPTKEFMPGPPPLGAKMFTFARTT